MSRRLLLAATSGSGDIPGPIDPEPPGPWEPPPYFAGDVPAVPTSAPWHRSTPCTIPTYDGYNQTLHPSVIDFGGKWNGYRWWMVHTPYPVGISGVVADDNENPSVVASNDCVTWTPVGPQPFIPKPESGYNSDADWLWNPDEARFELWWRPVAPPFEKFKHQHSVDGITWSTPTDAISPSGGLVAMTVIRFGASDYRMWAPNSADSSAGTPNFALYRSTATSPEGPWSTPVQTSAGGKDSDLLVWHSGATRNPTTGKLYMLAHANSTGGIHAATSTDGGTTWTWGETPVLNAVSGTWTEQGMYRPCLVLHENGTHARVWYSGRSAALGWRTGYAELPLTLWP